MCSVKRHVRFTPESGQGSVVNAKLLADQRQTISAAAHTDLTFDKLCNLELCGLV